jgi:hypothetical protein
MHAVAKPARIKAKAKKGRVDEAMRKLGLRATKISEIEPSYTSRQAKDSKKSKAKTQGPS